MNLVERILNRYFERRVIVNCVREPYLYRWYIFRRERIALFVHRFVRSDEDRALHDHPWSFLVIPLWGGYIEHSDREPELWDPVDFGAAAWRIEERSDGTRIAIRVNPYRVSVVRRVWPIISTRYRNTTYRHRVELINERPSWSLFFRFTKTREWGFWPKEGFILWNKWWQDKCE